MILTESPRPVAETYKMLLKELGQTTIVPHAEMLEMTDRPVRLKVAI